MTPGQAVKAYREELYGKMKPREPKTAMIMPDLQPYVAKAGDMAGKEIAGRKQHREFLRRNNLQVVGNEKRFFFENHGKSRDNPTRDW